MSFSYDVCVMILVMMFVWWFYLENHHTNIITKTHNQNPQPTVYKKAKQWSSGFGRFWECQKCNILVITQALVLCLIYTHSPSIRTTPTRALLGCCAHRGRVRIYQAKHPCLCYNLYLTEELMIYTLISVRISAVGRSMLNHWLIEAQDRGLKWSQKGHNYG